MDEPFLPADLEDDTGAPDWHERALREFARQLRMPNDFYYPLLSAAQELERVKDDYMRRHNNAVDYFEQGKVAEDEANLYRAALDRITKHPDCRRLIMQIACEALRGGVEREEG